MLYVMDQISCALILACRDREILKLYKKKKVFTVFLKVFLAQLVATFHKTSESVWFIVSAIYASMFCCLDLKVVISGKKIAIQPVFPS